MADKKDAKRVLGVFSVPSYITTGENAKYDLDPADKEKRKNGRWLGKQLSTSALKHGKTVDVYFDYRKDAEEKHKWLYYKKPYANTQPQKYTETQPRDQRKNGFMSSDANKRDEFSNWCRSVQLVQTIDREQNIQKAGQEAFQRQMGDQAEPPPLAEFEEDKGTYEYKGPQYVYDIGRSADTQFCMKCGREQFYCPHQKQASHGPYAEKRLGPARNYLSSISIGTGANSLSGEGSVFARRPLIKDTFYRQTGVFHGTGNPYS